MTGRDEPLAVIFDVDGVLVDSYQPHLRSWQMLAEQMGTAYSEQQFAATFGRTSAEILREHWPMPVRDEKVSELDDIKEQLYRRAIREEFPEMPGARELIRGLYAWGFRLAVGSSGPRENVSVAMEGLGLGELFGATTSREDVTRGKPEPEVFLVAAARLGVPPARCAVIEDAPAGVEAANRAGMSAIAITGTASREELAGALVIVDSLTELSPERIAGLILEGRA